MRGKEMSSLQPEGLGAFIQQMQFRPMLTGRVGLEREVFLSTDPEGSLMVPQAMRALKILVDSQYRSHFVPELSACQLEYRTSPVKIDDLAEELITLDDDLCKRLAPIGLYPVYREVGPADMPLNVYPEDRYAVISGRMRIEVLRAACRVTGTHVHVGMPDLETAIRVYNHVIEHTDELIELGDGSAGERMRLYRIVSPRCDPFGVDSAQDLYRLAREQGFDSNLRNCWWLIRITRYGTIEFRVFGNTLDIYKVEEWARVCHKLCLEAL
jgi:gamma-glutamyl:cysteine ligase YbdK (ATP-grasp superfamily)